MCFVFTIKQNINNYLPSYLTLIKILFVVCNILANTLVVPWGTDCVYNNKGKKKFVIKCLLFLFFV